MRILCWVRPERLSVRRDPPRAALGHEPGDVFGIVIPQQLAQLSAMKIGAGPRRAPLAFFKEIPAMQVCWRSALLLRRLRPDQRQRLAGDYSSCRFAVAGDLHGWEGEFDPVGVERFF